MMNLMLLRVLPYRGTVNFILAQLYGSSWFLVSRTEMPAPGPLLPTSLQVLRIVQESLPQERKARATIHHAFECFELIDFALSDALAPGEAESGMDGIII